MKPKKSFALFLCIMAFALDSLFVSCGNASDSPAGIASTYTITFNANDGTAAPATTTQTVTYSGSTASGVSLKANTFTRDGYTFQGWATYSSSEVALYKDKETVYFYTDTTLYAVWKADNAAPSYKYSFTITFDGSGGTTASGAATDTQKAQGDTQPIYVSLKQNPFTRPGYTFLGWSLYRNSSTPSHTDGHTYSVYSNTTFYAVWKSDTYAYSYTILFDGNGGTTSNGAATTTQMAEGNSSPVTITLDANPFSKPGCVFRGWGNYQSSTATYNDGDTYNARSNTTFYAVWTEVDNAVTLTLDANDGSGRTFTKTVASGEKVFFNNDAIYSTFLRDNHQLVAFNEKADGTGQTYDYVGLNGTKYFIELTSDATLYSVWKAYPHITFNGNGGKTSGDKTQTLQYQHGEYEQHLEEFYFIPTNVEKSAATETVVLDANPFTRSGYTFKGWSEDQNATTATYTDKQSVAAFKNTAPNELTTNWNGKTLYAVWQKIPTITYNTNGGSATGSFTEKSVTITNTVPTAKYSYYTFLGWSQNSAATSATYTAGEETSFASDAVTLYAVWKLGTIVNNKTISVARKQEDTVATFTLLKSETLKLTVNPTEDELIYNFYKGTSTTAAKNETIKKSDGETTKPIELDAGDYTLKAQNEEKVGSANTATVTLKGN